MIAIRPAGQSGLALLWRCILSVLRTALAGPMDGPPFSTQLVTSVTSLWSWQSFSAASGLATDGSLIGKWQATWGLASVELSFMALFLGLTRVQVDNLTANLLLAFGRDVQVSILLLGGHCVRLCRSTGFLLKGIWQHALDEHLRRLLIRLIIARGIGIFGSLRIPVLDALVSFWSAFARLLSGWAHSNLDMAAWCSVCGGGKSGVWVPDCN